MSDKTETLILQPWQIAHFRNIEEIFEHWKVLLDKSDTGAGKTYTAEAIALKYGMGLFVICNNIMESKWREISERYGINLIDTISYTKLVGKGMNVNHPYLEKVEISLSSTAKRTKSGIKFNVTPYFDQLLHNGPVLLVIDEVHAIKNSDSLQSIAVRELIKHIAVNRDVSSYSDDYSRKIVMNYEKSRIMLLSATPFDKESHSEAMLSALGFLLDDKSFEHDPKTKRLLPKGIQRARKICQRWDPEEMTKIKLPFDTASIDHYYYLLLQRVILPRISSMMKAPDLGFKNDIVSGFYNVDPCDIEYIKEGNLKLTNALRFCGFNVDNLNWAAIQDALQLLEKGKVGITIRLAREQLMRDPNCKVILAFSYIKNIIKAEEALREFGSASLYGETEKRKRKENINQFQLPNLDLRVLVINPAVAGSGIDLDDRDGRFIRWVFMIPSFKMCDIVQVSGRVFRSLTKSQPHVRLVWGKNCEEGSKIQLNIDKKSEIMEEIIGLESTLGMFPGEYPNYIEP